MIDRPPMTIGEGFYRSVRMVVLLVGYVATILGIVMVLVAALH